LTMRLATPPRIQALQRKLYLKAKREPSYRFYALYDKVCRTDILAHAYALAKSNGGAAGVDGVRFEDIEESGPERFLAELRNELVERRYRPEAVLRVMIPKPNGGERPLGIPTIKDRVVQAAVKLVLEPVFEADLTDNAYGYRPRRNAQDAVRAVHQALKAGHLHVVDADLSKYFDTIPHAELMRSVARRVEQLWRKGNRLCVIIGRRVGCVIVFSVLNASLIARTNQRLRSCAVRKLGSADGMMRCLQRVWEITIGGSRYLFRTATLIITLPRELSSFSSEFSDMRQSFMMSAAFRQARTFVPHYRKQSPTPN
jgi:hypothetical protein